MMLKAIGLVMAGVFMVLAILGAIAILAQSSEVWSDGYVELTLNEIYRTDRTDAVPPEFEGVCPPEVGHDFVVINLTFTRIEGRDVVDNLAESRDSGFPILFDAEGNDYNYTEGKVGIRSVMFTEKGDYALIPEGGRELLLFQMPKDREPVRLEFSYPYTESWENVFITEGKIEINLQATPTSPPLTIPTPTATATKIPTPEEKGVPGFEVIFAIAGLLAVTYLLRRRK